MVLFLSFSFIEIKFSVKHWRVSQNRQRMPVHEYQLYFSLLKLINRLLLSLTMIWYNVSLKQTDMVVPGEEYLWGWNQLWEKWLLMLTYLKIRTLRQGVHITDTNKKKMDTIPTNLFYILKIFLEGKKMEMCWYIIFY